MSPHSQIYLLGKPQPGLTGALERLAAVGYDLVEVPDDGTDAEGIAILCIGQNFSLDTESPRLLDLRRKTPRLNWIALFSGKLKTKPYSLHTLGFEQIYQIPFDEELFTNCVFERVPLPISQKDLRFEHLLRVNIPVLKDLSEVPFDIFIYLPSNRRIMLYLKEGLILDTAQLERFEKHKNSPLFIRKTDIGRYKLLSGRVLRRIRDQQNLSDEHKVQEVQEHIQNLMSPFFSENELSDDEGRQTVAQLEQILRGLQMSPTLNEETISSLEKLSAQKMTNASHSNNVAAYCALFGIARGMKNLDELRLGGLLHDVGLADLPVELIGQDETKMSSEDRARYHLHPGNGKTDVLNRRVPVTDTVLNMILYHHERPDGSGYPYGKKADEIPAEALICAFADEFDKLTSLRQGYRCYSPKDAMLLLSGQLGSPADPVFYAPVHQAIVDFYLKEGPSSSVSDHGEVLLSPSPQGLATAPVRARTVGLKDLAERLSPLSPVKVILPEDSQLEISVLEKEFEFYLMENGLQ